MEVPPIPEGVSVSLPQKLGIFHSIIILLCSFILSYYTVLVFSSGLHLGWGIIAYAYFVAPLLWAGVSVFYFYLLKKIYNPKLLIVGIIFVIINVSYLYYFRFKNPEPYPAHITTNEIYYVGDNVEFDIIPEDLSTVYYNSNSINVPISVHLPDGSVQQGTATIVPTTSNCVTMSIFFNRCTAVKQHFGFGIGSGISTIFGNSEYALKQLGHYTIESSNPNVKGTSFNVEEAINAKVADDVVNFPKTFNSYNRADAPSISHTAYFGVNATDVTIQYFYPEYPYNVVIIGISSYNSAKIAEASPLYYLHGEQAVKFNQNVILSSVDSFNRNNDAFEGRRISWISDNKIVTLVVSRGQSTTTLAISPADDFLKFLFEKYPSTLKKDTSSFASLPQTVSTYTKTSFISNTSMSGYKGKRFLYTSPSPDGEGNYLLNIDVNTPDPPRELTEADLPNLFEGAGSSGSSTGGAGYAYDRKFLQINAQKVAYARANVYGQLSTYFPNIIGTPIFYWISNGSIIDVELFKYTDDKSFKADDPGTVALIKAILDVYPSTLK